ncbi:hypothetical protein [Paractinoplanes deccanensis]|uniref:hypothetical protein n=1 Tax=Paractinoplanes deccanensis TaxID=113561 RepID=UPI0031DC70E7
MRELTAAAGEFLAARPVDHTLLLTEAAYLTARPSTAPDQLYGWWRSGGGDVTGAFLRAPAHPPILSCLPRAAIEELPYALPGADRLGVDARTAGLIPGFDREIFRVTVHRLREAPPIPPVPGRARIAVPSDRPLLAEWFHRLMAEAPDDPTEQAYVVDEPLARGGITLWEVDGVPVAMAGSSPTVAGMVRVGPVYAAGGPHAAFEAACAAARSHARDVLVLGAGAPGFEPVLDRVLLARSGT